MNKDLGKLSFFQKPHSSDCWRLRQFPELRISMAAVRIPFRQAVIMILKLNQNLLWIRCLIWKVDPFSTSGDLIIAKSNHPMFPNLFVKAVANLQTVLLTSNANLWSFLKSSGDDFKIRSIRCVIWKAQVIIFTFWLHQIKFN